MIESLRNPRLHGVRRAACAFRVAALGALLLTARCGGKASEEADASPGFDGGFVADAPFDANAVGVVGVDTGADSGPDADADTGVAANAHIDAGAAMDASAIADSAAARDVGAVVAVDAVAGTTSDASVADGRAASPANCDFTSCPLGCCDANRACQMGSPTFCGTGGRACSLCPSGTECLYNDLCACTASSCPTGCCAAPPRPAPSGAGDGAPELASVCRTPPSDVACGTGGATCADCAGQGGRCVAGQCTTPPPCTCSTGCCDPTGQCQPGASNVQCGVARSYCVDCTAYDADLQCVMQQCATVTGDAGVCNGQTCGSGCCDESGQCLQGLTATAYGNFGAACQVCLPDGVCASQRCLSAEGVPLCDANNCRGGCCDAAGGCHDPNDDTACGGAGTRCVDCTQLGDRCGWGGFCVLPDSGAAIALPPPPNVLPPSCPGCWDRSGTCQPGLTDTQCGEGGWCADCTALQPAQTCDLAAPVRSCTGPQCPAAYRGCPAPLMGPAPVQQKVCSASDLMNAASACAGGPMTSPCAAFVQFEQQSNDPCAGCLQPFELDFADQTGVLTCVAPYVDAACNHESACVEDCLETACYGCADAATTDQCKTAAQTGACTTYMQADACAVQALAGPAAFCNPMTYQGNYGAWLLAVGAAYCGM